MYNPKLGDTVGNGTSWHGWLGTARIIKKHLDLGYN
jgi:hypothetical protein